MGGKAHQQLWEAGAPAAQAEVIAAITPAWSQFST